MLATARLADPALGPGDGEAVECRFVAPDAIAADWFSPPEFPTLALFRRWRETGDFQLA